MSEYSYIHEASTEAYRTICDCDVFDVGPVTFPAYEATTAGLRGGADLDALKRERDQCRGSGTGDSKRRAVQEAAEGRLRQEAALDLRRRRQLLAELE